MTLDRPARQGEPSPREPLRRNAVWETAYFRRWSDAFARARGDGLELSTEDRLVHRHVCDPASGKTWSACFEHRSLHPADGEKGLPLDERPARSGKGVRSLKAGRLPSSGHRAGEVRLAVLTRDPRP